MDGQLDIPSVNASVASNLRWLARLRWVAIFGQALTILGVWRFMDVPLPLGTMFGIVAAHAMLNAVLALWLRRNREVRGWMLTANMSIDLVQLTALLTLSGGPSNPFSVLYLVDVALAALVLSPLHAWGLAALSTLLYAALFTRADPHMMHMHGNGMGLHLQGMWLAFAIASVVIVYFVSRVAQDLERQRAAVGEARLIALRAEKLASLGTLAAGAAHELATPLSTIAVVSKELEHMLRTTAPEAARDVAVIRAEVARCRHILDDMASDAGESAGEAFETVSSSALVEAVVTALADRTRVDVELTGDTPHVRVPLRALSRALRGIVKNALEASPGRVTVRARRMDDGLLVEVIDCGPGLEPAVLARVGEPFFTTKEPGRGMGLGVFLARATVERLGGRFELTSVTGQGTTARVHLRRNAAWPTAGA